MTSQPNGHTRQISELSEKMHVDGRGDQMDTDYSS